jgi:hypothetical protein
VAGLALGRSWEAVKQIVARANSALGLLAAVATVLLVLHFWRAIRSRRSR